jgi:cell fate (sporulation/competence/biofilm development) regulator YlbF (YheA/YmcA/DUF963 family)
MKTLREYINLIDGQQLDEGWFFKSPEEKAEKQAARQAKQAEFLKSIGFDPNYYNDATNLSDEEFFKKYGGTKKELYEKFVVAWSENTKSIVQGKNAVKDAQRANRSINEFINAVRKGNISGQRTYALKSPWYWGGGKELAKYPNSTLNLAQQQEAQNVLSEIEMQVAHWPKNMFGGATSSQDLTRSRELLQSLTQLQSYIPGFFGVAVS